mmetsp:Transcript_50811/g.119209  ORF Transcript_50811/g.119209 Transcript_50811/m.119209 type:complete len:98 (+) Transcript_50811:53-346(+)
MFLKILPSVPLQLFAQRVHVSSTLNQALSAAQSMKEDPCIVWLMSSSKQSEESAVQGLEKRTCQQCNGLNARNALAIEARLVPTDVNQLPSSSSLLA